MVRSSQNTGTRYLDQSNPPSVAKAYCEEQTWTNEIEPSGVQGHKLGQTKWKQINCPQQALSGQNTILVAMQ